MLSNFKKDKNLKKILLSCLLITSIFAEENKTQIYMDKYLPDSKMKQFDNISPEELREKSKGFNLDDVKTNLNMNKDEFNSKFGEVKTLNSKNAENQAKEVSSYVKSDKFQKGVSENEKYILYDKSIDWSKYTGKYNNQTKEIMEQLEKSNSPLL